LEAVITIKFLPIPGERIRYPADHFIPANHFSDGNIGFAKSFSIVDSLNRQLPPNFKTWQLSFCG
jgi:hypothetical protein